MASSSLVKKLSQGNEIRHFVPVPDYIPYACHYDADTLLTKNGELLQIIKIAGFQQEFIDTGNPNTISDVRDVIRKAVQQHIDSENFSLWFSTLRSQHNIQPPGSYPPGSFAEALHHHWRDQHEWNRYYTNELYITVLYIGQSSKIRHISDLLKTLSLESKRRNHEQYLDETAYPTLKRAVDGILQALQPFGGRRLTIREEQGTFYSEQLTFLARLINVTPQLMRVPRMDISEYIATHKVAFGFNAFEIVSPQNKKYFGAMLAIKDYVELSPQILDAILQLPQQFVITQSLDFIPAKEAKKELERQKYLLGISGANDLAVQSGLADFFDADHQRPTDYCNQRLSIMVISHSLKELDSELRKMMEVLADIGVVAMRRDLTMQHRFWSQLPGNFQFINRHRPLNIQRIGGFASLYNYRAGKPYGHPWGSAITILPSSNATPYFFDFHAEGRSHVAVVGPKKQGKTTLVNFLVAQAEKVQPTVYYLDYAQRSASFVKAMGGQYHAVNPYAEYPQPITFPMNPLLMADTPENRTFLSEWLSYLLGSAAKPLDPMDRPLVDNLVEDILRLPAEQRQLTRLQSLFSSKLPEALQAKMARWYADSKYGTLFNHDDDSFNHSPSSRLTGWELTAVLWEKDALAPVFAYLLHRILQQLDGKPAIIVISECWFWFDNPQLKPLVSRWLQAAEQKNAVVILSMDYPEDAGVSTLGQELIRQTGTQLFLPFPTASEAFAKTFLMEKQELNELRSLTARRRHFLLKQGAYHAIMEGEIGTFPGIDVLSNATSGSGSS